MPLVAGSLNFAWEINAVLYSGGYYGHILWTALDIFIIVHNTRLLERKKQKWYILIVLFLTIVLYAVFHFPKTDGMKISVFAIDIVMATEYVLCAKKIAQPGKYTIGILKLLGDLFAWLGNMRSSPFVAISGFIVLSLNIFYLAVCLEENSKR